MCRKWVCESFSRCEEDGAERGALKNRVLLTLRRTQAPARLVALYHAIETVVPAAIFGLVLTIAWSLQRLTTTGVMKTFDDDSGHGTNRPVLTLTYNWLSYALLLTLCVMNQSSVVFGCLDICPRVGREVAWAAAYVAVDACVQIVLQHIVIKWAAGCLLPYNLSHETWKIHFWDRVNPAPNRPEDLYEYGLDDDNYYQGP